MLFNSINFLVFFPIVVLFYFLIPHRFRYIWLLASSYYFYMCWNIKYALLMLFSTIVTYFSGVFIDYFHHRSGKNAAQMMKFCVAGSLILNLSVLFFFKYFNFALDNLAWILNAVGVSVKRPVCDFLLPVGISFYTFQALSYTMDVYRKEIRPEKNFLRYALFVSFFPQLVAGPIERSKNLLNQFHEKHYFNYQRVKDGLLLMLWGFFMKLVIADRLAIFVDQVYNNWQRYGGIEIILATIFFAIQIYCDFGSYSNIAVGAAQVMGFTLMKNFCQPYFAVSVKDFWRRWHISLTSWFRDYLYIPLGGNRKGKLRKQFNLMTVFLVSGLWHGASWHYIAWGGLNGAYQIVGEATQPWRNKILDCLKVKRDCFSYRLFSQIVTFLLIDISWLFFRANGLRTAIGMLKRIWHHFELGVFLDGSLLSIGIGRKDFTLLFFAIGMLWLADLFHEHRKSIRQWLDGQNLLFRWAAYYAAIFFIIIFGIYGFGYDATAFIYFQF